MKRLRKPDTMVACAFCRTPFERTPGKWGVKDREHAGESRFCPSCRRLLAAVLTVVEQASIAEKQIVFDELVIPNGPHSYLLVQPKGSDTWEKRTGG